MFCVKNWRQVGDGAYPVPAVDSQCPDMSSVYWQVVDIILSMKVSLFDVSVNFRNFHLGEWERRGEYALHYIQIFNRFCLVYILE